MDSLYYVRTCQVKTLVIALKFLFTCRERTAVVVTFSESVSLDDGAHRTIENVYFIL